MRKLLFVTVVAALLLGVGGTSTAHAKSVAHACPGIVKGVYYYRSATWKWQDKMDMTKTKSVFQASKIHSCKYATWVAHRWLKRATRLRVAYPEWVRSHPLVTIAQSLVGAFLCIHRYEGAWNSNTGNGYYGGLQMDSAFQSKYGSDYIRQWGTADKWPVWAQINAAVRAYRSGRGFYPWPNTARACGLI